MTAIEKLRDKLIAEGFTLTDENKGVLHLSRMTKVGAPPNKATGQRVDVFFELDGPANSVDILVEAHNGDAWCRPAITGMSPEYVSKHFKMLEQRVVYAWRELSD
ncbi:hypothetical protein FDI24_gp193 [Acidovorax phage ACP17]|uniref:Uncharacterized protein n=1 Tax=Acidovorax phage ACP17 TaxID=2010329 RepID=A0A218M362_9CAUD|nr:hypothetical protein FDI24_gp193 [Acidovorax phage ACP17]ASD50475.1 hypothetical protein [Acidovorax phage ACP17]